MPMKIELYIKLFPECIFNTSKKQTQLLLYSLFLFFASTIYLPVYAQNTASAKKIKDKSGKAFAQIKQTTAQTLKASRNAIWFQKNNGQFGNTGVLYGFRTSFGSMGVYNHKLRIVTEQVSDTTKIGKQVVDISFPGSLQNWAVLPGKHADVKGTYNTKSGSINAPIFNEITIKNVYHGIDLRLYSGENGALEFDWLVARAEDYKKIQMNFEGQDSLVINKNGDMVIDMRYNDMKIVIPETYQLIDGHKKLFATGMRALKDKNTFQYDITGNINPNLPMVIDPVMLWSTYMHNNTSTFDEYLYTIAVNTASEVYACGLTNEAISTAYMSGVAPGFLSTYNFATNSSGYEQSVILYRLNPTGTAITAWTYTGQTTNVPVALGIFPNNRILVIYQADTVQIFSADLTTRFFNNIIAGNAGDITYQSQAIIDNDVFYVGGIADVSLPTSLVTATAPDPLYAGGAEGLILRIKDASTAPVAEWGTYVGGSSTESFTAIAATPDKSKLAFAVHVNGSGGSYPALVNSVDNTISGNELLIGVLPVGTPTAFSVFSYLGGSANEGKFSDSTNAALVAADNNYFYVAGNTSSNDMPGTAGSAQPTHGANTAIPDQFLSQIPLNGSAGTGFITTYNGGDAADIVGGLVIDLRTNDVLLFGTTESINFPVYNASAYSPFYQGTHGSTSSGPKDITYTVFANGLATRKFSTFIGGSHNDYMGSTGKLKGTGHFQYNPTNGFTYIGTTIHSDETTIPGQWMSFIPGFDKSIPPATKGKDNHFIFAMSPNTLDFGDAPASYDAGTPASSAVSFFNIRIGNEVDAEEMQNSSVLADGDDNLNSGSTDDEEGIISTPTIVSGATTFSITVSVFNNTGAMVNLCGWIDNDGNGVFDINEYATVAVPSNASQQSVVLNFTGLPTFTTTIGYTFLRLRITDVTLTAADATGDFGKGEVEDHLVLQSLVLPLLLSKFSAIPQDEDVLLNWTGSKSTNVQQYEIQYATNPAQFNLLGSAAATNNPDYSWLHTTPARGINYYRLKIIFTDGTFKYSGIQKVNFSKKTSVSVYPNPAGSILNISFTGSMLNKPGTISFLSIAGKVLARKKIAAISQVETMDVSRYPQGQYLVQITYGNKVEVKKINVGEH